MNDGAKYISFEGPAGEFMVIFSQSVYHRDMAYALKKVGAKPVGAGFVKIPKEEEAISVRPYCYGRSDSLKMKPRDPEDDILLWVTLGV